MFKGSFHKKKYIMILVSLLLVVTATVVFADSQQVRSEDTVVVEKTAFLKGPVFYAGNQVRISGTIDGMAFIAGREIAIDGIIQGDLFVAGQNVSINGQVLGNLFGAANRIQVNGKVEGDALLVGERVHGAKGSGFGRDLMAAGTTVFLSGNIERQLFTGAKDIVLDGTVGDDSNLASETLEIRSGASLHGDVKYKSANEANIDTNAAIQGNVHWELPDENRGQYAAWSLENTMGKLRSESVKIVAALLVWYSLVLLAPGFWSGASGMLREMPLKAIGVGLLVLILVPLLAGIALFTVIGVPVGMIAFVMYGTGIYITKIVVAAAIGYAIGSRYNWKERHNGLWCVALGLVILSVLSMIPIVNLLASVVVLFGGLGALLLYALDKNRRGRPVETKLCDGTD